jgi:hypothetical protein
VKITLAGHITPEDKRRSDYLYVPFDLAEPTSSLSVRYGYSAPISSDEREGGNVIDIGLFDPRGMDFPGGSGFRGWSGSARKGFTISTTGATPGYLPGPLPAGRYHIILGLYRIWPEGADYEIAVSLGEGPSTGTAPPLAQTKKEVRQPPPPQADGGPFWLRGDLQSHTDHSDAKGTLSQLLSRAMDLRLDFLAVTDHNTVSHHPYLADVADEDLLLIPGQEATSYYGHLNIWGTSRWCDFRCRDDDDMAAVIDLAHSQGGLCSINHPKTGGPAWEYSPDLPVDAIEAWQGPWPWRNEQSLALWDDLLTSGRRLTAVGGSDYHCPAGAETSLLRLGQPTTWVKSAGRSVDDILDAIRCGRVSISALPIGPFLEISAVRDGEAAGMGEELAGTPGEPVQLLARVEHGAGWMLRCIADGAIAREISVQDDPAEFHIALAAETYVRAELVGDAPPEIIPENVPIPIDLRGWRWALTNPIYIRPLQKQAG